MDKHQARLYAFQTATRVAEQLLQPTQSANPERSLVTAVDLIEDWILNFKRPDLAVQFANMFHSIVERWAAWGRWTETLGLILRSDSSLCESNEWLLLLNYHSQVAREAGRYSEAHDSAEQALQLAEKLQEPSFTIIALTKLSLIALREDSLDIAEGYLARARVLPRDRLGARDLGNLYLAIGVVATRQSDLVKASDAFHTALQAYDPDKDQLFIAKVQCNLADLARRTGNAKDVPQTLFEAIELFQVLGNDEEYSQALNDLGCFQLSLGQYDEALRSFNQAIALCRRRRSVNAEVWIAANIIETYVRARRWLEAQALINEIRPMAIAGGWQLVVAAIDIDWGTMLKEQGDLVGAVARWQLAREIQLTNGAVKAAEETFQLIQDVVLA